MIRRPTTSAILLAALAVLLVEAVQAFGQTPLPRRFYLAELVRPSFEAAWRSSLTFRRQCEAIEAAGVVVAVGVAQARQLPPYMQAKSDIVRQNGRVAYVRVTLRADMDWPVQLAHEFEHVVEQLEGIDLRALAVTGRRDAWRVGPSAFETRRAQVAASVVQREMTSASRDRPIPATLAARADQPIWLATRNK